MHFCCSLQTHTHTHPDSRCIFASAVGCNHRLMMVSPWFSVLILILAIQHLLAAKNKTIISSYKAAGTLLNVIDQDVQNSTLHYGYLRLALDDLQDEISTFLPGMVHAEKHDKNTLLLTNVAYSFLPSICQSVGTLAKQRFDGLETFINWNISWCIPLI